MRSWGFQGKDLRLVLRRKEGGIPETMVCRIPMFVYVAFWGPKREHAYSDQRFRHGGSGCLPL